MTTLIGVVHMGLHRYQEEMHGKPYESVANDSNWCTCIDGPNLETFEKLSIKYIYGLIYQRLTK